jgi:hypothetical protein
MFFPDDPEEARARIRTWLAAFVPYWPAAWARTIDEISRRAVVQWGEGPRAVISLISRDQYDAIVRRDLAFPQLNEKFDWYHQESSATRPLH